MVNMPVIEEMTIAQDARLLADGFGKRVPLPRQNSIHSAVNIFTIGGAQQGFLFTTSLCLLLF